MRNEKNKFDNPHGLNTAFCTLSPRFSPPLPQVGGVAVARLSRERGKPTHRTPHSPTLITARVEDHKILIDTFVGGKFKGT